MKYRVQENTAWIKQCIFEILYMDTMAHIYIIFLATQYTEQTSCNPILTGYRNIKHMFRQHLQRDPKNSQWKFARWIIDERGSNREMLEAVLWHDLSQLLTFSVNTLSANTHAHAAIHRHGSVSIGSGCQPDHSCATQIPTGERNEIAYYIIYEYWRAISSPVSSQWPG